MLKKMILYLLALTFIFSSVFLFAKLQEFHKLTQKARASLSYCKDKYKHDNVISPDGYTLDNNDCFNKMYQLLLPEILIYKAKYKGRNINIQKITSYYSIPENIIADSDAILSWGIGHKMDFESEILEKYQIPVYAFDCSITNAEADAYYKNINSKQLHIQRECIGSDKYINFDRKSTGKIHSFSQKMEELNLENKKVSLKFSIQEFYRYIDDVLKYKDNILSISIHTYTYSPLLIYNIINSTKKLNKDFVLISRQHSKKDSKMQNNKIKYFNTMTDEKITLLYVNKKILDDYYIPLNQESKSVNLTKETELPKNKIDSIVVIYKKLRDLKYNLIH